MGILTLLWLVAQEAIPTSLDWKPLGIGALIALPAWTTAWLFWRAWSNERTRSDTLARELLARERELSGSTVPLLASAVERLHSIIVSAERRGL